MPVCDDRLHGRCERRHCRSAGGDECHGGWFCYTPTRLRTGVGGQPPSQIPLSLSLARSCQSGALLAATFTVAAAGSVLLFLLGCGCGHQIDRAHGILQIRQDLQRAVAMPRSLPPECGAGKVGDGTSACVTSKHAPPPFPPGICTACITRHRHGTTPCQNAHRLLLPPSPLLKPAPLKLRRHARKCGASKAHGLRSLAPCVGFRGLHRPARLRAQQPVLQGIDARHVKVVGVLGAGRGHAAHGECGTRTVR